MIDEPIIRAMLVKRRLVDDFIEELNAMSSEERQAKLEAFLMGIEEDSYLKAMKAANGPVLEVRIAEAWSFVSEKGKLVLPRSGSCGSSAPSPRIEEKNAERFVETINLFFALRSLGRREEAGKLAASLLECPYEIRSREGNRPAAFAQAAEALGLSFPVCLLEEEAVATLAEKGEDARIVGLYRRGMINASSLLSSLEGRKGRLEILKAAVEATPLSGHEDEAAALLSGTTAL